MASAPFRVPTSRRPSAGSCRRARRGRQTRAAAPVNRKSEDYFQTKALIFGALIDAIDLAALSKLDPDDAREEIRDIVHEIVAVKNLVLSIAEQEELLDDICNDVLGFGPLEPLLARDEIADIMVNGPTRCFIEVDGKIQLTSVRFRDNGQLMNICQRIVSQVGRRVDESSPICDARLLDGSRVNVIAPPLSIDGVALTIRKFRKDKLTLDQLVRFGVDLAAGRRDSEDHRPRAMQRADLRRHGLGQDDAAQLPHPLHRRRRAGRSPARTPPSSSFSSPMWCGSKRARPISKARARSPCAISCATACACGPERIIVGEVRGPEAFDLLQAMNTGHDGSMGTLHANSPREALSRIELMISMGGYTLPVKTVREMIASSIDVIIQAARLRDGSRRITHITEVVGMEGDVITTQDLIVYDIIGEDAQGKLKGRHRSTGIGRPRFWERARVFNEEQRLAAALDASEAEGEIMRIGIGAAYSPFPSLLGKAAESAGSGVARCFGASPDCATAMQTIDRNDTSFRTPSGLRPPSPLRGEGATAGA